MLPIYCVNLERATERTNLISKKWIEQLGLNIAFWKAFDRRQIEEGHTIYSYDKNLALQKIGRELNTGEIACCTSFCMLYKHIIENNHDYVIVMEDDVIPLISSKKELFKNIDIANEEFPHYDILILHNTDPRFFKKYQINDIYYERKENFSRYKQSPWGNQMLYIKLSAIKKMYSILTQMYCPADYPQQTLSNQELIVCGINNPLCYHIWNGKNSTSYIQNEHRKTRRKFIP